MKLHSIKSIGIIRYFPNFILHLVRNWCNKRIVSGIFHYYVFRFNKEFEGLIIVPAVLIPVELLKSEKTDNEILSLESEVEGILIALKLI